MRTRAVSFQDMNTTCTNRFGDNRHIVYRHVSTILRTADVNRNGELEKERNKGDMAPPSQTPESSDDILSDSACVSSKNEPPAPAVKQTGCAGFDCHWESRTVSQYF